MWQVLGNVIYKIQKHIYFHYLALGFTQHRIGNVYYEMYHDAKHTHMAKSYYFKILC